MYRMCCYVVGSGSPACGGRERGREGGGGGREGGGREEGREGGREGCAKHELTGFHENCSYENCIHKLMIVYENCSNL